MVARFRHGSKEKGRDEWRPERDRKCRICGIEEETIDHMIETCCPTTMTKGEILSVNNKDALGNKSNGIVERNSGGKV